MTGVEIAAAAVWGGVVVIAPMALAPFLVPLHKRIAMWFHGDDHDAGRKAELAWWNDASEHAKRQALKATNDVSPSVADQAQTYDAGFVIHAECVGRPLTIIVGKDERAISNPENVVGDRGGYERWA